MTLYRREDDRRGTDRRVAQVQRRRLTRMMAQVAVAGLVFFAGVQFAENRQKTAGSSTTPVQLEMPPLWRPVSDVLDRPVADGPWKARTATLARFEEGTESLLRWNTIFTYARQYRVTMELATLIHDIALEEKIEPELAFRLVRLESRFDPNVVSHAGAIGLTQLMLGTARYFQPGVTVEQLTDPSTNLRIGFRYLRGLVREYRGDLKLALLVYNRGPTAVLNAIAMGEDPANGYDRILMRGYTGRGVTD